jgi:hypothetical protein
MEFSYFDGAESVEVFPASLGKSDFQDNPNKVKGFNLTFL